MSAMERSIHWDRIKIGASSMFVAGIFVAILSAVFTLVVIALPKDTSVGVWVLVIVAFVGCMVYGLGWILLILTARMKRY